MTNTATGADSELVRDGNWPAFSPDGGKIAFERMEVGAGVNVWVINSDGSGLQQLTTDGRSLLAGVAPAWTLDGRIIFNSTATGTTVPHVMNADGSGRAPYTPPWANYDPPGDRQILTALLSPDGSRLASTQGVLPAAPGSTASFYLSNADGSGPQRIDTVGSAFGWSHDGARLAVAPASRIGRVCVQGTRTTFTATRLRGRLRVRTGGRNRQLARRPRQVTAGTVIDARRGSVKLSLSRLTGCTRVAVSGRFAGARFRLSTGLGLAALLNRLRLVGPLERCPNGNGGRILRVSARGPFHVHARRLYVFNTGVASYTVADTCTRSSVVRTRAGRVFADPNPPGGKVVRVRTGRRYLTKGR